MNSEWFIHLNGLHRYRSRVAPVLDFAERESNLKRWPVARTVDREFALKLRVFLNQATTTRNGRLGGTPKPLTATQIILVLETLRAALAWARSPKIRKLPADWANPFGPDIIGQRPAKDPLREAKLPLAARIKMVAEMGVWELSVLGLSLVLPLRPEEATGILVSEVDFDRGWITIGTRLGGADVTKGCTSFKLPFPDELFPLIRRSIGDRSEGPLLRSRRAFAGLGPRFQVASREALTQAFECRLAEARPGTIETMQDRKELFRQLLVELGGLSTDALAEQFKRLAKRLGLNGTTLKDLRSSISTDMERSGIDLLNLRYLTSHSTNDIMNEYVSLNPCAAMAKYFATIAPLLGALAERSRYLGI